MMIGIVVGMVVVGGVIAVYVTTIRGGTYTLRAAKLNEELRATMDIVVADVRRAGYWYNIINAGVPTSAVNPFVARTGTQTDLSVMTYNGVAQSCAMYAYDTSNGANDTVDAGEVFGFRFNTDRVEMQNGVATATSDCTVGGWEAITDNNTIIVDSLTFATTNSQCQDGNSGKAWKVKALAPTLVACAATIAGDTDPIAGGGFASPTAGDQMIESRQISITLVGHHVDDPSTAVTLTENVQVENDRMFKQP